MQSPTIDSPGPDFLIIGAMKCMTSTLHEQLAAQPGIFMTTPKEPYYFSNDEVYAQGEAWYRNLFSAASAGDLCGESSTHYTKLPTYPHTVERMHAAFPDLKLIYVMRHPIDRLVSQYVHEWSVRRIDCPIDEAVDSLPEMVDYSRYAYQLEPYLHSYGPDRILPVFLERLQAAPQAELERIAQFLGATDRLVWVDDRSRQNSSQERMRSSWLRDAIAYAPGLSWFRRTFIPRNFRDRIKALWKLPAKPTLSLEMEQRLKRELDTDLQQLGRWLGVQLSCDHFKKVVAKSPFTWKSDAIRELHTASTRQETMT
ncbi:sulfotransferase [Aeoliella sp. ICT_H6.2]|uniref:Sulfotransferase n=1 Tax=Aeoliella straminimaris TaxID=2954799 RepID=A0A9X2FC55_9BACT|nr:sulfotransferase [Aeoliella straminimaris]MCO6045352.1 sulfotransferase [Aeoliella straminimaris]